MLPCVENTAWSPPSLPPTSSRSSTTCGAMFCRIAHTSRAVGTPCNWLVSRLVARLVLVTSTFGVPSTVMFSVIAPTSMVASTLSVRPMETSTAVRLNFRKPLNSKATA